MQPEAFYLPMANGSRGQRFCLFHPAAGAPARAAVLYIHPFAEEMNKSRRMASLQARAFALSGCAVLQLDLLGCGDSSGDFGDATWADWVLDVVQASQWLQQRVPAPLWLWGLRAGCLLAAQAADAIGVPCNHLYWQAPSSGKTLLHQFLRLKAASEMLGGQSKGVIDNLRQQLAAGRAVDIAGYRLSAGLANGLEAATLTPPARAGRVEWIEVSAHMALASATPASATPAAAVLPSVALSAATPSAAALRSVGAWRQAGLAVRSTVVNGPAFWHTVEIETAPELIEASLAALTTPAEVVAA